MEYAKFDGTVEKNKSEEVVVNLLRKEALRAVELAKLSDIHVSLVHLHLKNLKKKGLVVVKRFGMKKYWGLVAKQRKK